MHLVRATDPVAPVSAAPPGRYTPRWPDDRNAKAHPAGWALHLFDAWQFMAGVLPATLRAVAAQRSNPLPADLSSSESAHRQTTDKTKARSFDRAFCLFDAWQFPTLTWGDPTLPSALRRFTSEFGMGSGGTTALVPPGKFCFINTSHQRID